MGEERRGEGRGDRREERGEGRGGERREERGEEERRREERGERRDIARKTLRIPHLSSGQSFAPRTSRGTSHGAVALGQVTIIFGARQRWS